MLINKGPNATDGETYYRGWTLKSIVFAYLYVDDVRKYL